MNKKRWMTGAFVLGVPALALAGTFATQWSLEGKYDVDLIEGPGKRLPFVPSGGDKVVIGLIDTGIDYRNPFIADALWHNPGEIPGNCVDDDQNGYIDDVHGIRVDLQGFDGRLSLDLAKARTGACEDRGGTVQNDACVAAAGASVEDVRAIAGLNVAYRRAENSFAGNPLLYPRDCPNGFGETESERRSLAKGDPIDYWWGHGTLMANTMAARSGVEGEPASLFDLTGPAGERLGEHVEIVTCATGYPANVAQSGKLLMPRGTHQGAVECADYFLGLKARGVNLLVVNMSFGFAEKFPLITGADIDVVPDALLHNAPEVVDAFARLSAADITLVAAAHNLFRDIDDAPEHAMYPAAFEFDNVIGVGGINERGVWFGNRGRSTADFAAPAQRIIHYGVSPEIAMMAPLEGRPAGAFDLMRFGEGTSQATAYVSSAVALLKANARTASLRPRALRALLLSSATELPSLPWMLILRPSGDSMLQAIYWAMLGAFEPSSRATKQAQLSANTLSGRIVRVDRALACQDATFTRLTAPVPRMVGAVGEKFAVRAESYVCERAKGAASLNAQVTLPDGTAQPLVLAGLGDGRYASSFVPAASGSYVFALTENPDDALTVSIP